MRDYRRKDALDELITSLSFRLMIGGLSVIKRPERYPARSPYNRILLVQAGRGRIEVEDRTLAFTPGQLILIPTDVQATYDKCQGLAYYWLYFRVDFLGTEDLFHLARSSAAAVKVRDKIPVFRSLLRHYRQSSLAARMRAQMLLIDLLLPFLPRIHPEELAGAHGRFTDMLPIVRYIDEHLPSLLTVAELAGRMFLNPVYFSNVFSKAMGMPPTRYINCRRVQKAKELLFLTRLSIEEVATRVGFADPFYFSRIFRRIEGLSPMAYRRTHREGLAEKDS